MHIEWRTDTMKELLKCDHLIRNYYKPTNTEEKQVIETSTPEVKNEDEYIFKSVSYNIPSIKIASLESVSNVLFSPIAKSNKFP